MWIKNKNKGNIMNAIIEKLKNRSDKSPSVVASKKAWKKRKEAQICVD